MDEVRGTCRLDQSGEGRVRCGISGGRLVVPKLSRSLPGLGSGCKRPQDECGVFGIFGHPDAARLTYYGLFALQHRGQESCGIVTSDGEKLFSQKGMGLVAEVFSEDHLGGLPGRAALGHVRYSTTGSSLLVNAQPLLIRYRRGHLALAHNGNLVNAGIIRDKLEDEGSIFQTTLDTEVLAHLIARKGRNGVESAIVESLKEVRGGYVFVFLTPDKMIGVRDPHGIRPLSLGRLGDAWVFASESCAFDTIGAEFVRDVEPGEMVVIGPKGIRSIQAMAAGDPYLCVFEYIYFARPDSNLQAVNVHAVRKQMGRALAREHPVEGDLVIGVPDSSISAASGYAEETGIPYEVGLVKNRYIGRTFIQPRAATRVMGVKLKLNPLRKVIGGRRVVLVDDSIVRGTTSRHIVSLLREAGAREVHLRISSPPYRFPCHYGIDTSRVTELIAVDREIREIEDYVGADSLRYLSLEGMLDAVGSGHHHYCRSCFSGDYFVPIPERVGKYMLETGGDAGGGGQA